jgi:predicted ATPase
MPGCSRLRPLEGAQARALLGALAPAALAGGDLSEVLRAAGGNPLFLEQLLALRADPEAEDGGVPPSIGALMSARIEQLPALERRVAERAAVVGQEFWAEAVRVLGDGEGPVAPALSALARRELVEPGGEPLAGHSAWHFRHALIRDAAYDAMPKQLRSRLHEVLAEWLEAAGAPEEIAGHHLERAHRLRLELRPPHEISRDLGERAADRIGRAGRRALSLGDMPAAAERLGRAAAHTAERRARSSAIWARRSSASVTRRSGSQLPRGDRAGGRRRGVGDRGSGAHRPGDGGPVSRPSRRGPGRHDRHGQAGGGRVRRGER